MSEVIAPLDAGRHAGVLGRWREAYAAYSQADGDLSPDDLEVFADAAWWTCRPDEALELRQRAFAAYGTAGERCGAARAALSLYWDHSQRGALAVSHGWLAKAERLLEGLPESPEYAQLVLTRGLDALFVLGDVARATPDLDRAYELGHRLGDCDVQAVALTGKGSALVRSGEVDRGLALLDEATAAAVSGELRPFAAGFVYCCTISSCQDVGDYRRASEWTEAANRWYERLDVSGFPGACRIHRAQIMRFRGDWSDAEQQAAAACQELQGYDAYLTGTGFYEIGEVRRWRGDFASAVDAYRKADELGREPQPGLAFLRLAEGKVDAAVNAIRRSLENATRPLMRVQLLPAQVEIAIAAGDLAAARAAADELERIVAAYKIGNHPSPAFDATVHLATGQIRMAEGDWATAIRCLRHAREEWQRVGAPYEAARARMLLGIAYRRRSDEDGAMAEFEAAAATFERLGARLDEERVKELLGRLETRRTFVFTDVVGSTRLLETLGDEKWKRLLARHDQLLRACILEAGGEVIKQTGDGFFASFDNPQGAVQTAIAIQRALDAEVFAPDVRIGVHTGGAFFADGNSTDYGGQGVHVAARVGASAQAGEILVTQETLAEFPHAFAVSTGREQALKGFEKPVTVVSVTWR